MNTIKQIFKRIEELKQDIEFMPTGFSALDAFLDGGFMRKELIVLGGFTGFGKSYLAGQIFYNIALNGFKSAYFSLEISNEMVASRLVGALANIKPTRVMVGFTSKEEHEELIKRKAQLSLLEGVMSFYDNIYLLDQLKKEIKAQGYEFVVIDFIQNVMVMGMDEYSRLSLIALELQKLAKECNCTILVLSQLSNQVGREKSKTQVEYKGSGSIATVCDLGFFIERAGDEGQDLKLLLKKNRRGVSGTAFPLNFRNPGGYIYAQ